MPSNSSCTRCILHAASKAVCVWGQGAADADIMLVGEALGAEEEVQGKPFVGSAGQQLDLLLRGAGLARKDVYVTNINKCRPPGNRAPLPDEVVACLPYLAEEIETVKPKVIICLGGSALKALTGLTAVGASRGRVLPSLARMRIGDAQIIGTYHPASYLHNPGQKVRIQSDIREDFSLARKLAGSEEQEPDYRILIYPGEREKLIRALSRFKDVKALVCDTEWLASFETEDLIWPWDKRGGFLSITFTARIEGRICSVAVAWDEDYRQPLAAFMRTRKFTFHNAMADLIWLLYLGFTVPLGGDTLLLAYLQNEEQRLALDQLAPLMAGVTPGWKKPVWRERPKSRAEWKRLLNYNADDTYATIKLEEALWKQMDALGGEERGNITRAYYQLLLPAVPAFARAAINGVGVNVQRLEAAITKRQQEEDKAVAELAAIADVSPRDAKHIASSPKLTRSWLQAAYGLDLDSSRKEELDAYSGSVPAVSLIRTIRHEQKLNGTYLRPWRRLLEKQRDGRIHSVYRLASSRSGRTSAELAEGGSLQLAPREEWVRQIIEAHDAENINVADPWVIVAADYSQIELRIIAWLAPERTMRRLYEAGEDLHATTAAYVKARLPVREFWKRRAEFVAKVTKTERQAGKSNNFGFVYGMQAEHYVSYAQQNYGVTMTLDQAVSSRNGFFQLYGDLESWHNRVTAEDFQRGWTLTPTGRYRRNLKAPTEAINTPIQGTASDLTMFAATVIDEQLAGRDDAYYIGFVHDSVLFECRASVAAEIKELVKQAMENLPLHRIGIDEIPVPLVADVKVGKNWGDAS